MDNDNAERAVREILKLEFNQTDKDRMRLLLAKAKNGTLTADEQVEMDSYERIGHLLSLMKSKARRWFKRGRENGTAEAH